MARKKKKNESEEIATTPIMDEDQFDVRSEVERHSDNPDSHKEQLQRNATIVTDYGKRDGKKRKLSTFIFVLANILAIALTVILELSKNGSLPPLGDTLQVWGANIEYIIYALLMMIGFFVLDSLKFMFMIRNTTKKWRPILSLKTSILGKYYDNITPLAAGGQPFQMYYLSKEGVPGGVAGAMPVVNFFFSQLSFVVIGILLFTFNMGALQPGAVVIAYVGALISITVPMMVILFSLFPKTTWKITKKLLKLLNRMRIIKDLPKAKKKVRNIIFEYARSLGLLTKSKLMVLSNVVLSLGMQIAYCSVAYFVLRAFGDTTSKWIDVLTMCFAVYAAVSYIPTPGASGAAEISFGLIFAGMAANTVFWGTLLWRGISYYLTLVFGIAVLLCNSFMAKKHKNTLAPLSAELPAPEGEQIASTEAPLEEAPPVQDDVTGE